MMKIKLYKQFNESMTSLAADMYFSTYGDHFTQPNEYYEVKYCSVKFPDGRTLAFNVLKEDYMSDTLNLKIGESDFLFNKIQRFYLKLFGDSIQFESTNEYKFVRKYTTWLDILDSKFNAYIYSDTTLGFSEVEVQILKNSNQSGYTTGVLNIYHNEHVMNSILELIKDDKTWRTNIKEWIRNGIDDAIEIIHLHRDENTTIKPADIIIKLDHRDKDIGISELLYLYHIVYGINNTEDLRIILQNPIAQVPITKIFKVLGEVLRSGRDL